jgi:hypothetical protein
MTQQIQNELDRQQILEILDLAKEAEQQTKGLCEMITNNTDKWRQREDTKNVTRSL